MANEILYKNLKTLRTVIGVNQKGFAAILGIPTTTYAHHEQGNSEPSLTTTKRLLDVCGIALEDLTDKDISKTPECDLRATILSSMARRIAEKQG